MKPSSKGPPAEKTEDSAGLLTGPLEPLNTETFHSRLNALSRAVNAMEEFRAVFIRQHPRYGERLP